MLNKAWTMAWYEREGQMRLLNDLLLTLLGTCEFWVVFVSGFVALVVYVILDRKGFPVLYAIGGGGLGFLACLLFLLPSIC